MTPDVPAVALDLRTYLREGRESVLRGLDGLSEYNSRRPLTVSGSNILGLIKHLIGIESGYLGDCVGRPADLDLPWVADGSIFDGADMWATADDSRDHLLALYRAASTHSDATITELPLDAPARVPWWPEARRDTTFGHLLVRVVAETAQHAGHIDILREAIDGRGGRDHDEQGDAAYWTGYVSGIQQAAEAFRA